MTLTAILFDDAVARIKELEKELEAAVQKARTGGLTAKEIRESFEIIMEDEVC